MSSPTLSGGGLRKEREWTVAMSDRRSGEGESWPLIERGFTEAQRKELEEQGVISRHLSAGLPVPLHLVLPIWKSVVASLGPSNPSIYKQYPSFIGFILQGFDCKSVMDPEPGRCRRTDGKKWRCSRDVLSDQKYCERHIHRGRQRSRKLVEAAGFASPLKPIKPEKPRRELLEKQKPNSNLSVSVGLQLMTPSPGDANASCHNNTNTTITGGFSQKRISCVTAPFISTGNSSGPIPSPTEATDTSNAVKTGQDAPNGRSGKLFGGRSVDDNKVTVAVRSVSKVLDFSPTSVLQVVGSNGSQTGIETQPGRCRRTDGKKWRCRREVVTNQKYCPRHMHRGAKKLPKPYEPTLASFSRPRNDGRTSLSTDLCISVPTSPPPVSNDEKSSCSASSDTTLSDSSISAYVISRNAS